VSVVFVIYISQLYGNTDGSDAAYDAVNKYVLGAVFASCPWPFLVRNSGLDRKQSNKRFGIFFTPTQQRSRLRVTATTEKRSNNRRGVNLVRGQVYAWDALGGLCNRERTESEKIN